MPHACLPYALCLEFLPLNPSFCGKRPPAPCSPTVGNRIISPQKTTVKPAALEPVDVT